MPAPDLSRRLTAEGLGTAALLVAVVGSGIMAERLAGGNMAVALLANALATGAALVVLITILGPLSGAHFNPAVTLWCAANGGIGRRDAALYVAVAAFYYFRIVRAMFLQDPLDQPAQFGIGWGVRTAIVASAIFTVAIGIYPEPFINLASESVLLALR